MNPRTIALWLVILISFLPVGMFFVHLHHTGQHRTGLFVIDAWLRLTSPFAYLGLVVLQRWEWRTDPPFWPVWGMVTSVMLTNTSVYLFFSLA